ncbi:hypothetical protein BRARA_B02554 [Brassica rapa]|uniref:RNase H type-1 domain-containing protein n=1 Tax=Brassica campestris TaxID=3711 RepID=A0A398AFX1_BRACM|nr:hypothetical protein BRARA_B02554 [Brassica rapa]
MDQTCKLCNNSLESINHSQISVDTLISQAIEEAKLWSSLNKKKVSKVWQHPSPDFVKCNMNGSWRNAPSMVGGTWILRDHQGRTSMYHS